MRGWSCGGAAFGEGCGVAGDLSGGVAGDCGVWWDVFGDDGACADGCSFAYCAVGEDVGSAADVCVVVDFGVSGDGYVWGDVYVVADLGVVADVGVCHEEGVFSYGCGSSASCVDCDVGGDACLAAYLGWVGWLDGFAEACCACDPVGVFWGASDDGGWVP